MIKQNKKLLKLSLLSLIAAMIPIAIISAQTDEEPDSIQYQYRAESNNARLQQISQQPDTEIRHFQMKAGSLNKEQIKVRNHLSIVGQRMASYTEELKSAINKTKGLAQERKDEILVQLSEKSSWLQREAITLNKSEYLDTLRERTQELKDYWRAQQNKLRYYQGVLIDSRVRHAIERLELLEAKIDVLIQKLSENNIETAHIGYLKDEFVEYLNSAKAFYQEAHLTIEQIQNESDQTDTQEMYNQAKENLRRAHGDLKQAHSTFKNILRSIKELLPEPINKPTTTVEHE